MYASLVRVRQRESLYLLINQNLGPLGGSFKYGPCSYEILVYRQPYDSSGTSCSTYEWVVEANVDDRDDPTSNSHVNQTVLI